MKLAQHEISSKHPSYTYQQHYLPRVYINISPIAYIVRVMCKMLMQYTHKFQYLPSEFMDSHDAIKNGMKCDEGVRAFTLLIQIHRSLCGFAHSTPQTIHTAHIHSIIPQSRISCRKNLLPTLDILWILSSQYYGVVRKLTIVHYARSSAQYYLLLPHTHTHTRSCKPTLSNAYVMYNRYANLRIFWE